MHGIPGYVWLVSFLERYSRSYLRSVPRLREVLGLILKTVERQFYLPIGVTS